MATSSASDLLALPQYSIVRSFLRRVHAQHYRSTPNRQVLEFDSDSMEMMTWFWPVYDRNDQAAIYDPSLINARVAPADLEEYRRCHRFVAPCCLCTFIDNVALTECRIGVVGEASGGSVGQYMAECARKRCGYSVCLEDFYPLHGLRVKKYPFRTKPLGFKEVNILVGVHHDFSSPEGDGITQMLPAKGSKRGMDQGDPDEEGVLAKRLVMLGEEGLPDAQFWNTFIQCFRCKWVILRSKFPQEHSCSKRRRQENSGPSMASSNSDIIDLTDDLNDASESSSSQDPNEFVLVSL
ncbi:hypothetical protein BKA70DRAFT_1419406 [Coprinopsis sp. MPI-PUGE-AT-0042]|nr:hypothetical protein BKA70DRAFT_1419406 [Coprinopsis sp. MPI-PUGE-AT-0042]